MIHIGIISDPEQNPNWTDFQAFLEPARERGGLDTILGPDELLWAVFDGPKPIAAATTRLTEDGSAEVILVGGIEHRRWIAELDRLIGACAREAGASRLRAGGRRGWVKTLCAQGWQCLGERGGFTIYERDLGAG